jgi:hypothetical protein
MEHTNGLWFVAGDNKQMLTVHAKNIPHKFDDSCNAQICDCFDHDGHFTWEEMNANAAFIVTACNCHDELLEACKEAFNQIQYLHEKFTITGSGAQVLAKLKTAIDKAEAE